MTRTGSPIGGYVEFVPVASVTVTAYTIAAVLLGVLTRRNLASLRYRRP